MKLTWYGHAAFRIETPKCAIITDPYNYPLAGGYEPINEPADIVTISHINPKYHSDTSAILPPFELINGLEFLNSSRKTLGVTFRACRVSEDDQGNGPNAMIRFEIDGINIAHMGDCGHPLNSEQFDFLRGVDVLLAPAGGKPTIALPELMAVIRASRPRLVVAMHFKTPKINLNIVGVEHFEALAQAERMPVNRIADSSITITRETLPRDSTGVILEYAR